MIYDYISTLVAVKTHKKHYLREHLFDLKQVFLWHHRYFTIVWKPKENYSLYKLLII